MEFPETGEPLSHRRGIADRSCYLGRMQPLPEKKKVWPEQEETPQSSLLLLAMLLPVPSTDGTLK